MQCGHASMQVGKYAGICKYASMQVFKYASMQVCKYESMKVCKYASMLQERAPRAPHFFQL